MINKPYRYNPIFLIMLSTLCFWLAWPPNYLAPCLFLAFVPLLYLAHHPRQRMGGFYKYVCLALFLWNATTTWWVAHATVAGALVMGVFNTWYMTLPWLLFWLTNQQLGRWGGYAALLAYWVSMEYIHLQWECSFPWLTLGNGFARWPSWVQWYEYTGILGGTIWVIIANLLVYTLLTSRTYFTKRLLGGMVAGWILLPVSYSHYRYWSYQEQGESVEIVIVQPNLDPYTDTCVTTGEVLQGQARLAHLTALSATQLTPQTKFLIWPETAIDNLLRETSLHDYPIIQQLLAFKQQYPALSILTGLNSLDGYGYTQATKTARFSAKYGYYDIFNTALFVDQQGTLASYHKSKLVPGVEIVPYIYQVTVPKAALPNKENKLYSLGMQDSPRVFFNKNGMGIAPIICYEAVYGDHVAAFVRQGAALIFSMNIDGWWKNTPGYRQHFHYTRLRAIESRRSIARSALKGISAFINQRGDILQATTYKDQGAIKQQLQANSTNTFYVRHGEYLAKSMLWVSLLLIISTFMGYLSYNHSKQRHARP